MPKGLRVARTPEYERVLHSLNPADYRHVDRAAFAVMKNPSMGEDDFSGEPGGMVYIFSEGKKRYVISYCWPLNDMLIFTALWVGKEQS